MKFTFGIVTGGNVSYLNEIIKSIECENIPEYEIIIIGNIEAEFKNTRILKFYENIKQAWITKKKNMITEEARFDNIVYMHDYIKLVEGWYKGFLDYGDDWKLCMNKIINYNGERFRDWCLWDVPAGINNRMIPYDIDHLSKLMYFSGSYWVAKKDVMKEFPLDENLAWGQGEDVSWSRQVREKYKFSMNVNSSVKILKAGKDRAFNEVSDEEAKMLKEMII